jgi:hypothetical protein
LQKRLPRRDIGAEGLMRNTLFGAFHDRCDILDLITLVKRP